MPDPNTRGEEVQPFRGLDGKCALVIGGTRGVGRAVTAKLVASGCNVVAAYLRSDLDAEMLLSDLKTTEGHLSTIRTDVRRPSSVSDLMHETHRRHGRLDFVVHSPASAHPMSALSLEPSGVRTDMSTSVVPLAAVASTAADLMDEGGRIVAVSASVARGAAPGMASLGMAKAAMESLVRFLAVELAPSGVTVNAISASKIDKGADTTRPEAARMLASRTPAGRLARPADVADAVAMFCLPESQWITGQVVSADGGLSLSA